MTKHSCY